MAIIIGLRTAKAGGAMVRVYGDDGERRELPMATLSRMEARHSPEGFQWGYDGSGPTELARAILVHFYPGDDRVRHPRCYRTFRVRFISGIKADIFELPEKEIREWYEAWLVHNEATALPVLKGWIAAWEQ